MKKCVKILNMRYLDYEGKQITVGGVAICFFIFGYGAVSYSIAIIHIMLALALVMLSMSVEQENSRRESKWGR